MTEIRTPSLFDVITAAVNANSVDLRVAMPAMVQSYDASTKLADVQPLLLQRIVADDGSVTQEKLPVIPSVPVVFPRGGGGFFIEFPLQAGDNVLVVFCDNSLDLWKTRGATTSNPLDPLDARPHTFQGAVCYPGLYDGTAPATNSPANKLAIGKIGGTFADAARKDDQTQSTSSTDSSFWSFWSTFLGVIRGLPINEPGNGSPSAFQAALISAFGVSSTPSSLTGKITAGSSSVQIS